MIDTMLRRPKASNACEACWREPATHRAKFTVQYLQSSLVIFPYDDEILAEKQMEMRVCSSCLTMLRTATNVKNLTTTPLPGLEVAA